MQSFVRTKHEKILTILLVSVLMLTGNLSVSADNTTDVQKFTDVSPTDYFYEPVKWAIENGITNGASETTFSPDEKCNVGQIMTFLWRAAGQPQVHRSAKCVCVLRTHRRVNMKSIMSLSHGLLITVLQPEQVMILSVPERPAPVRKS